MSDSNFSGDELQALRAVQAAREDAVRRVKAPWWYHWALGLVMGALVACFAMPIPVVFVVEALAVVALGLLVNAYRRHTGVWINGYRKGRTRWVAFTGAAVAGGTILLCSWLVRFAHVTWAPIVGGVFLFLFITALGYAWEAAYRRDLGVSG